MAKQSIEIESGNLELYVTYELDSTVESGVIINDIELPFNGQSIIDSDFISLESVEQDLINTLDL